MKKKLVLVISILYLIALIFFRFGSAYLRDTLSYHVDVLYMFYYESEQGNSLFTVTDDCIYYDDTTGMPFLYILEKSTAYEDDGYYIQKLPVSVTPVGNGFVFLGSFGENQNVPIIVSPVKMDMCEKRAVIADTIEFKFTERGSMIS